MIQHQNKVIFVHINRTSGHSISANFDYTIAGLPKQNRLPRHAILIDYKNRYPKEYPIYTKFTFVRNPFDRLISAYLRCWKLHSKTNPRNYDHFDDLIFQSKIRIDFNQFVRKQLDKVYLKSHFRPQNFWINDLNFYEYDFIGRFEHLEEDLKRLAKICKMKFKPIVHLSKTRKRPFEEYYNKASIQKVKELYKKDFEIFDRVNKLF